MHLLYIGYWNYSEKQSVLKKVVLIGLFGAGCLLNERDADPNLLMKKDGEVAQDSLKENPESDTNTESIGSNEETTQPAEDPRCAWNIFLDH